MTSATRHAPNNPREVFGWMMYDWANSGFQTTVVTVLAGPYLTALAQAAVSENGVVLSLGPLGAVTAKSLFPFCVSASVLLQVALLLAERGLGVRKWRPLWGRLWTIASLLLTAPLFIEPVLRLADPLFA
mgnify:CR=1 FL=1